MKNILVSVTNDLNTDQRVNKVCAKLHRLGFNVTLIGRKKRNSLPLTERAYTTKRMILLFEKGPLFYVEYHIRLFCILLVRNPDVLLTNDLDTLLPNYLISKIKKTVLVYDTHELFCEVPELQNHPIKKKIWKKMERFIFPKLKYVFTVNDTIARIYEHEYKIQVHVVRNIPSIKQVKMHPFTKEKMGIAENKKIILLQGAGINIDRGAEEAVLAMQYIDNAILLIIGGGDVIDSLKQITKKLQLTESIKFIDTVPFEELNSYTQLADIGLTLDKDSNLNYRYSLPNKLFDYIHAEVPVLASNLPEIKKIIEKYKIGAMIENHNPKHIAKKLNDILEDEKTLANWKANAIEARKELNWENEEEKLLKVFELFL